jgi:hypothetical protein
MALRLRRGTDTERQLITPVEGELIYTTDTKLLYVGDGSTLGGVLVTGSGGGAGGEVIDDTTPQLGGNLDLNGFSINGTGNINATGTYNLNGPVTLGDGSSVTIVNSTVTGNINPTTNNNGDIGVVDQRWGGGWFNTLNAIDFNADVIQANVIFADGVKAPLLGGDSSIAFDPSTNEFTGNLEGDTSGTHYGFNIGDVRGSVRSTGGQVVLDSGTDGTDALYVGAITATGTFDGVVTGEVQGSVFADDSSILVDGINAALSTGSLTLQGDEISSLTSNISLNTTELGIISNNNTGSFIFPNLQMLSHRGTESAKVKVEAGDVLGSISAQGWDTTDYVNSSSIAFQVESTPADGAGDIDVTVGIGKPVNLFALNGNYLTVNSAGITAAPVFQPNAIADNSARDTAIPSPTAGMIIFVTDGDGAGNPKFQGNTDGTISGWVNLN